MLQFNLQRTQIIKHVFTGSTRSSRPEVFLRKGILKICSEFTEEHLSQSVTLIKLHSNFIEITLWHRFSPVNLLHRAPFLSFLLFKNLTIRFYCRLMHHLFLVVRDQATLVTLMITKKKLCEFPALRNAPKNLQIFNHKFFLNHGLWVFSTGRLGVQILCY